MGSSSSRWRGLLQLLGPLLFIFFILEVVDPWAAAGLLKGIRLEVVLSTTALFPVIILARTLRWKIICRPLGIRTPFRRLFQVYYIGWFLGAFLPGGIAGLSKVFYLKEEGEPAGRTLISVILEKLFDIIGLILFGLYGFFYFPRNLLGGRALLLIYGGTIGMLSIGFLFGRRIWDFLRRLAQDYMLRKLGRAGRDLGEALEGFWSSFGVRPLLVILGLSLSIGLLRSFVLYALATSLRIDVTFGLMMGCRALIGITQILPITISGLGTRDGVLLLTMPLAGAPREAAIALGFVTFLWAIGFRLAGVVFWIKRPVPYRGLISIKERIFP